MSGWIRETRDPNGVEAQVAAVVRKFMADPRPLDESLPVLEQQVERALQGERVIETRPMGLPHRGPTNAARPIILERGLELRQPPRPGGNVERR